MKNGLSGRWAIALRTLGLPFLVGARMADRRGATAPEPVPPRRGGWAERSNVLLDEIFFATELAMAPLVSLRDGTRLRTELEDSVAFFRERGWLDDPRGYHRAPPPAEVSRFDEYRSGWLPYRHMRFESDYEPHPGEPGRERWLSYEENRTGHAWLLKHPGPQRPWLVCIPGYRMGHPMVDFTGFRAGWLHRTLGLNVAIPVIPLHGPRRVGRRGGDGFFSGDFVDTVHAQAQAVWDIRRLVGWLRSHGAPAVGTYGVSLGGYTAALHASLEEDLACVVVGIPATDFGRLIRDHVPGVVLGAARRFGISFDDADELLSVVSPFSFEPRPPRDRRFLYAGISDKLTPPDHAHALWRHWDEPRMEWFHGGHVSFLWQTAVRDLILEALGRGGMAPARTLELAASAA